MHRKNKQSFFPKDFFWGVSTAAHQVEGGNYNQWTVWELQNAAGLAKTAHRRMGHLSNWEDIKPLAENPNNYISGKGVDHFRRYAEDFDLAKSLNFNAFRFSVEWSRIEPEEGQWNEEAIEHYRTYIRELKARGLEPFMNIWHYTLPVWFDQRGGFIKRSNLTYFERFVAKLEKEYADQLKYVITINEPNVYTVFSSFTDKWKPNHPGLVNAIRTYLNLATAHKRAYQILKAQKPTLQIGMAAQLGNIQAKRPHNMFDEIITKVMRFIWNWWFLTYTKRYHDFIGFNYYYTDYFKGTKRVNPRVPLSDLGWYMEPEGLYPILLRLWARYKKPMIVTENGLADSQDKNRQWWLEESIVAMERALSEGVDIRGYFHWSLLDNFEWADGWWPKFGLVAIDREHGMKRTMRPSATWYAERIKNL